uniref:Uncharacterized protein n=1 Tax=Micrurus surinamensis TaxID=129470 RepID=A0A2D4NYR7_MICSU
MELKYSLQFRHITADGVTIQISSRACLKSADSSQEVRDNPNIFQESENAKLDSQPVQESRSRITSWNTEQLFPIKTKSIAAIISICILTPYPLPSEEPH